ncbi:MAG TPA: ribonuclease P protein component [Candidatus Latescibacteria bacterium]|jgi:ribonuclease P protein component|nr:ribonuclease P protein component [Gemmatimonadaceae bacterium]MDP6014871.1 ribonuclease P protein component [Candidatus Latescibacterota bacterium]HJP33774.1 ribonuclease P protein component [Candidatus Latescibacterota bacterium]|tara:strand:- start:1187 stop:1459 length:273 start_codon:yes stop_codon:yes gene_type:complete
MPWTKGQLLWVRTGREPGGVVFVLRKRLGKAVLRNRLKRRLRHACRELELPAEDSLVVLAQAPAAHSSFQRLREELAHLVASLQAEERVL